MNDVSWHPQGNVAAAATESGELQLLDTRCSQPDGNGSSSSSSNSSRGAGGNGSHHHWQLEPSQHVKVHRERKAAAAAAAAAGGGSGGGGSQEEGGVTGGDALTVAFDPLDGNRLATGGADGVVCVLDVRRLEGPVERLLQHAGGVNQVAWSGVVGGVFASCSDDAGVLLWDVGGTSRRGGVGGRGAAGGAGTTAAAGGGEGGGVQDGDPMEGVENEGGPREGNQGDGEARDVAGRGRKSRAKGIPMSKTARQAQQERQEERESGGAAAAAGGGGRRADGAGRSCWGKEALAMHKVVEKLAAPGLSFMHAGHLGQVAGVSWHGSIPWLLASVSRNTEEEVEGVVVQESVVQVWRMARPGALTPPF